MESVYFYEDDVGEEIMKILGGEKKSVCRAIVADEIELAALGFRTMFKKGRTLERH